LESGNRNGEYPGSVDPTEKHKRQTWRQNGNEHTRPRKPRMKIHNIPEEITTDNIEDTLRAQKPDIGIERGDITP